MLAARWETFCRSSFCPLLCSKGNMRAVPRFQLRLAGTISLPSTDSSCMWAQPLYVPGVTTNVGVHNILYVATANANVYAYDADSYSLLWSRALGQNNLGPSLGGAIPPPPTAVGYGGDTDLVDCGGNPSSVGSQSGIVGTPVIDLSSNTMYVVGNLLVNNLVTHYLFGIDTSSGVDKVAPATIASAGNVSVPFTAAAQLQRPGLLLADYSVLVPYASYGDHTPYQGWMFSFNRSSLGLLDDWNYGGAVGGAGIWMSGGGASFDGSNVYFATGNNAPDVNPIGYSNSLLQVSPYGGPPLHNPGTAGFGLAQINQFLPPQASEWVGADRDLGSSRTIVVPGSNEVLVGGKAGNIYVVDRTAPMRSSSLLFDFNCCVPNGLDAGFPEISAGLAFWKNAVYVWAGGDYLRSLSLSGVQLSIGPDQTTAQEQGVPISISSYFDDPNTGLVWAVVPNGSPHSDSGDPHHFVSGQLRVYNASTLALIASYDIGGNYVLKFTPPVVANGKVYVVTASQNILYSDSKQGSGMKAEGRVWIA